MDKMMDMVLVRCPIDAAPTIADYKKALDMILEYADNGELTQLEPVQYGVSNAFAGGFITESACESVGYCIREQDALGQKICAILDDIKNNEDIECNVEGLRVAIIPSEIAQRTRTSQKGG